MILCYGCNILTTMLCVCCVRKALLIRNDLYRQREVVLMGSGDFTMLSVLLERYSSSSFLYGQKSCFFGVNLLTYRSI